MRGFRRWAGLAVLSAIGFLGFLNFQLLGLLLEPVKHDLALSDTQIGLLNGFGVAIFYACAAVPIGWLADRFDRRRVLAGCLLFWSAATASCGFSHSFVGYAAGVIGMAIGESAMIPIIYAMIPPLFAGRDRATANAIVYAVLAASGGLGLLIGGAMLGWVEGLRHAGTVALAPWRAVFASAGLVGLPLSCLLALVPAVSEMTLSDTGNETMPAPGFASFLRANLTTIIVVFLAGALYYVGWSTLYFWTPAIMARAYGYSTADAGTAVGTVVLAATAVGVIAAWWAMRRLASSGDALRMARLGCWIALPPLVALGFTTNATLFLILLSIVAASLFFATAIAPMIMQDIAPSVFSSRTMALYPLVLMVPRAAAPSLVGMLSDGSGSTPLGLLLAVCIVCGATLPLSIGLYYAIDARYRRLVSMN